MTNPIVREGRVAFCGSCGKRVPRKTLRRQLREWGEPAGTNYFLWSSYNSAFWACSATDAGEISVGCFRGSRVTVSATPGVGTTTEYGGSQTWTGTGTFRSIVAVNAAALTTFVVCAQVGPYHCPTASTTFTVAMGLCDSAGNNKTVEKTYTAETGQRECWFAKTVSAIASPLSSAAVYVYFTVTPASGESWWIDALRFEGGKTRPTELFETAGAARVETAAVRRQAVVAVCPRCIRQVFKRVDTQTTEVPDDSDIPEDIEVL